MQSGYDACGSVCLSVCDSVRDNPRISGTAEARDFTFCNAYGLGAPRQPSPEPFP